MTSTYALILAILFAIVILVIGYHYLLLWLRAYVTNTRIHLLSLVLMTLRKVNPEVVVQCKVMLVQAGLANVPTNAIEAHLLTGGDVPRVTLALIAAHRAGIKLDWDTAAAIDLAGRDILEAVQVSVDPKVIFCPDPVEGRGDMLSGVAKDGIQLNVRVWITVKTNVLQIIGGAAEPTVIARVGQAIVSAIGSCESYRDVLANPLLITHEACSKALDSQTSFSVVSVDIADITVGSNVGAALIVEQAKTDLRIAQAKAESRRAMAFAETQEMTALMQKSRAALVLAEAQIPKAIAQAYRMGQMRAEQITDQSNHPALDAGNDSSQPQVHKRNGHHDIGRASSSN